MVLENSHGELLIVKAGYKRYWTLPGGVIDPKESPRQAAIREVNEEVGLTIKPEDVDFLQVMYRSSDIVDTYQFIFKAPLGEAMAEAIVLQESEIEACNFVSKEQVKEGGRTYAPAIVEWANDSETISYGEQVVDLLQD